MPKQIFIILFYRYTTEGISNSFVFHLKNTLDITEIKKGKF